MSHDTGDQAKGSTAGYGKRVALRATANGRALHWIVLPLGTQQADNAMPVTVCVLLCHDVSHQLARVSAGLMRNDTICPNSQFVRQDANWQD